MQPIPEQSALYLKADIYPIEGVMTPRTDQLYRNPRLELQTRTLNKLAEGNIRVQMEYVGICGTDIHIATADPITGYVQSSASAVLDQNGRILGHEGVGRILEVADNVQHLKSGQLVAFESILTCGYCEQCRNGRYNQCEQAKLVGMEIDGLFSNIIDLPAKLAFDVTDFVDTEGGIQAAACLEPAGVGFIACENAQIKAGDKVAVLGAGPIGLLTVMLAKSFGASQVTLVEPIDFRRNFASQWADICYTPEEFQESVNKYNVLIDAAGDLNLVANSLEKINPHGRVVLLARNGQSMTIDKIDLLITNNISIVGARGHLGGVYEKVSKLYLANCLPMHQIITKNIVGLEELAAYIEDSEIITQENCKVMCSLNEHSNEAVV